MEGYHLATDKLCKSFGSYHALIDINLRIERGQIVVIIGGSGAGKTTLLKILVGLEHTKLSEKDIHAKVKEKLEVLNLFNVENRMPSELSGGMKKRVGLARALMLEPEVLMYDEPTSGLDPLSSRLVDDLIAETRDRFGVTSVVISHDMAGALQTADNIYVLSKGKLAAAGTPQELIGHTEGLAFDFFAASGIDASRLVAARKPKGHTLA